MYIPPELTTLLSGIFGGLMIAYKFADVDIPVFLKFIFGIAVTLAAVYLLLPEQAVSALIGYTAGALIVYLGNRFFEWRHQPPIE